MARISGGKLVALVLIALIGAAAAFGYFNQATVMDESEAKLAEAEKTASPTTTAETQAALKEKSSDIIIGDTKAPMTIVEYSSLSCNHCAHFHQEVLPKLTEEFIAPGKVKLVVRHFPLNPPALKAAVLVECAGQNGQKREIFMKTLFEMQSKWAFDEGFEKNLKQIAAVGGIDSAVFDSCMADKSIEDAILLSRQEGETVLKVNGTPAFYINGVLYAGERTIDGFRKALESAQH